MFLDDITYIIISVGGQCWRGFEFEQEPNQLPV